MPDPSAQDRDAPASPIATPLPDIDDIEGVGLTDNEARALALRLVAGWAQHSSKPEWDEVPNLGEYAYDRLMEAIVAVAGDLAKVLRAFERQHDIDSADLLEKARA